MKSLHSWSDRWTQPNHWLLNLGVLFVGLVWIIVSRAPANSTTAGQIPAPQAGFLSPDFTLFDQQGQPVQLSELRGHPVLINYWASWCPPCRAEMPAMEEVYRDYQAQGLVVLAINATNQDERDRALAFAAELGLSFPILFDEQGLVGEIYQVRSLPTSFFVDAQGFIHEVVIGGPMAEALLRTRIEQLLQEQ